MDKRKAEKVLDKRLTELDKTENVEKVDKSKKVYKWTKNIKWTKSGQKSKFYNKREHNFGGAYPSRLGARCLAASGEAPT